MRWQRIFFPSRNSACRPGMRGGGARFISLHTAPILPLPNGQCSVRTEERSNRRDDKVCHRAGCVDPDAASRAIGLRSRINDRCYWTAMNCRWSLALKPATVVAGMCLIPTRSACSAWPIAYLEAPVHKSSRRCPFATGVLRRAVDQRCATDNAKALRHCWTLINAGPMPN